MGNKNYNIVKVEIPITGEYILTILDHMLIVKHISEDTYQYSEFTNIADKYIMTSVHCKNENVMRMMEEFCKSYNCPKRILREEINRVENIKNNESIEYEKFKESGSKFDETIRENRLLIDKLNSIDVELERCKENLANMTNKFNSTQSKLSRLKDICKILTKEFNISDEEYNKSTVKWNKKENDTGIYVNKVITTLDKMDDGDVINFIYEKIKSFMDSNSEKKDESKCLIDKFYNEFIKTLDVNEFNITYDVFIDFLKDIYRNHKDIKIDDRAKLITNIIYRSNDIKSTKLSSNKKASENKLDRSEVLNPKYNRVKKSRNKSGTRNISITSTDSKVILDMWKTMTAKQIAEVFPMYNVAQIGRHCSTHSDFVKIGTPKKLIDELKSYNGTKTLQEMAKLCGRFPSNVKKLCKTYDIQYKEE